MFSLVSSSYLLFTLFTDACDLENQLVPYKFAQMYPDYTLYQNKCQWGFNIAPLVNPMYGYSCVIIIWIVIQVVLLYVDWILMLFLCILPGGCAKFHCIIDKLCLLVWMETFKMGSIPEYLINFFKYLWGRFTLFMTFEHAIQD